jgi:hypothetical protein
MKCLEIIFAASLANQHGSYMSKKLYVSGYLCSIPGKWTWNLWVKKSYVSDCIQVEISNWTLSVLQPLTFHTTTFPWWGLFSCTRTLLNWIKFSYLGYHWSLAVKACKAVVRENNEQRVLIQFTRLQKSCQLHHLCEECCILPSLNG